MSANKEGLGAKFERFVAKLDAWVAQRSKNEVAILALAVPLILLAIDYKYIVPKAEKAEAASETKYKDMRKRIDDFNSGGGADRVRALGEEVAGLQIDIKRLDDTDMFIIARLSEIEHLFYSSTEWAQHLNFVTQSAAEHHITLQTQENAISPEPEPDTFAPVVSVSLDGYGGFNSVLRYLFLVEASDRITPIEKLKIELDDKDRLKFTATSVLWGIK
ncbi:MAG: hypothetical protein LBC09_03195 [Helicobacteraceae bacterium]|jgi:hypothetical protein|nr:hypothetical protein [Helicobacteraceae bacterium]